MRSLLNNMADSPVANGLPHREIIFSKYQRQCGKKRRLAAKRMYASIEKSFRRGVILIYRILSPLCIYRSYLQFASLLSACVAGFRSELRLQAFFSEPLIEVKVCNGMRFLQCELVSLNQKKPKS